METMSSEYHAYDEMSVGQLANIRDDGLDRVNTITQALKHQVKTEHDKGVNIKRLAHVAGVTRPTIYKWLAE